MNAHIIHKGFEADMQFFSNNKIPVARVTFCVNSMMDWANTTAIKCITWNITGVGWWHVSVQIPQMLATIYVLKFNLTKSLYSNYEYRKCE